MWCAEHDFKVPVQGVRFFNVYGRNEGHKGQPSPVHRYIKSAITTRQLVVWHHEGRLGSRDFISVDDCIQAMVRLKESQATGVFNVGTGKQLTFEDIARLVQKHIGIENAQILVTHMPTNMVDKYQWESCANLNRLKQTIPDWNPDTVEQWLEKNWDSLYNKIVKETFR